MPSAPPTEEVDVALKKSATQYEDWVKSLEELKKRVVYLQALEKQFLATRDMGLLEEFKDKIPPQKVELAEKVKHPCAISREDGWLEEFYGNPVPVAIRERIFNFLDAEARLLNPNVSIRHIKDIDGKHTYRVYEGIDENEFNTFYELKRAEQDVKQKIKQSAGNCTPPNYTARITQEKLTGPQAPQLQRRM